MQVALVVAVKAALMKAVKARWIDRGPTCRMQCNTRHATGGPESPYTPTEHYRSITRSVGRDRCTALVKAMHVKAR